MLDFSEAMFYENYLTSDFYTYTVISRRVCLLVKMASKTVIRPIRPEVLSLEQTDKMSEKRVSSDVVVQTHRMHKFENTLT